MNVIGYFVFQWTTEHVSKSSVRELLLMGGHKNLSEGVNAIEPAIE